MIQITPQMRILVAVDPVDFRRGIDGLARLCRDVLDSDPFAGWLFVFRNRRATAIKILTYDSQGFWLAHKRLSSGRFRWWPSEASAAARLEVALGDPEVRAFLPDGPTSEEGLARFIDWVRGERRAGRYLCFTVVPRKGGEASGLFQLWPIEPGFEVAEFGCALGRRLWGTGLFVETATAVVSFAVDELGARRIECRSAVGNAAGAASLRKLGAVREGILRRCFRTPKGVLDHIMWSILAEEWDARRGA